MKKILHSLCVLSLIFCGISNASEHKESACKKRMMTDNNAEQQADSKKIKKDDSCDALSVLASQAVSQEDLSMEIDGDRVSFSSPFAKFTFLKKRAESELKMIQKKKERLQIDLEKLEESKRKMQRIIEEYEADNQDDEDDEELTALYFDDLSRP